MELTAAERDGTLARIVDVIDVQVEVDLLLLAASRPLRRDVVRGVLDADDPFSVDHDAVPVVVAMLRAPKQTGPETTLGFNVRGVEHDDAPNRSSCLYLPVSGEEAKVGLEE